MVPAQGSGTGLEEQRDVVRGHRGCPHTPGGSLTPLCIPTQARLSLAVLCWLHLVTSWCNWGGQRDIPRDDKPVTA